MIVPRSTSLITTCQLTCPKCGHVSAESMPTDACVYFYDCAGCGSVLRPKPGELLRVLLVRHGPLPTRASGESLLSLSGEVTSAALRKRQGTTANVVQLDIRRIQLAADESPFEMLGD